MERQNAIVVFERDVQSSELNELFKDFHGDVVINGNVILDSTLRLQCNLYVGDYVYVEDGVEAAYDERNVYLEGDLWVYGYDMNCDVLMVQGSLYSDGDIDATYMQVGEDLYCDGDINVNACDIIVAGNLECNCVIEAETICVLGKTRIFSVDGETKIEIGI